MESRWADSPVSVSNEGAWRVQTRCLKMVLELVLDEEVDEDVDEEVGEEINKEEQTAWI